LATSLSDRLVRARSAYAALERFAARRARFLDALDLSALGTDDARTLEAGTDRIMTDLAEAWLLVDHLEQQITDIA